MLTVMVSRMSDMQSDNIDRRAAERLPILTDVQLSHGGMVLGTARTTDISATGFAGSSYAKLKRCQTIEIGIGGIGNVSATIVRAQQNRFAAHFKYPIDWRKVDLLAGPPTDALYSGDRQVDIGSWA